MPNRIILRNSTTPGAVPSAASLQAGELAINAADGALYTLLSDNTTVRTLVPAGGANGSRISSPTWSANMTLNWKEIDLYRIVLGGTTTLTFTGAIDGQRLLLELYQDGTGGRSVTFPTMKYPAQIAFPVTISTTAYSMSRLGIIYNAFQGTYDLAAVATGYSYPP